MRNWLAAVLVLSSCNLGEVEDDAFWDDTSEDDGEDAITIGAGTTKRVAVVSGDTDKAELFELLPIGRSENSAERRVALQLKPAQLPRLAANDRLIVPAELQVTTRCDIGQNAPGCNYNPNVRAQLLLTGSPGDTTASGNSRVIATQSLTCTKDEHHCMFVFRPGEAAITLGNTPCVASNSCYVNLVVWAWNGSARSGGQDKLIIGGNEGNFLDNGKVDQDKARIMAVRERGIGAADRAARQSSGNGNKSINTNANDEIVYTHRLKPQGQSIKKGEQFLVEAKIVADVGGRARFSTQLELEHKDAFAPGGISESAGTNCSPGRKCVAHKVAVFRATQDINDGVHVKVVVKSAVPGGGTTRVTVKQDDGWVKSVRYAAALGD
jgi:hypothetical protein